MVEGTGSLKSKSLKKIEENCLLIFWFFCKKTSQIEEQQVKENVEEERIEKVVENEGTEI